MQRSRGFIPALLLGAMLVLASTGAVWAHAVLREAVPADGARLEAAPHEILLRFNEPVAPVAVQALGADGRAVAGSGAASTQGDTLRLALPHHLPVGTYVVSYRVASADGHPVAGSITFGIGTAPEAAPTAEAPDGARLTALAAALVRAVHDATLLAGVGGGLFLVLVSGPWSPLNERLRPGLCALLVAAGVSVLLLVGLAGAVLAGAPISSLASTAPWAAGAASTAGSRAGLALMALLVGAAGLALEARHAAGRALLVLGALAGAASLAATGHAATAPPRWLSAPLVALHGLMAAYWIGALWPLAVALRTMPPTEAARLTRRFSRLAVGGVAALVAAGAGLSILQIGTPGAVLATDYGHIWLGKMLVVLGLLLLAARNRLRLTPALDRGGWTAAAALRRSVWAEVVFAAVLLLLTSLFPLTPPPRALPGPEAAEATGRERGYTAVITQGGRTAMIEVTPARPGRNRVRAHLHRADGATFAVAGAALEWELPAVGVAPLRRTLSATGPGELGTDDVEMPIPGRWSLRLEVLVDDFEKTVFRTEIPVGAGSAGWKGIP
ncbi:copper resistance protein CopC [Azospirillum sp.]|uniref:copper resistance CopC/CopD family protein n=1 Tax=Azospirillum sp. TaxID=34012 RepID=UPI002D6146C9|nr:copper resistance protein CopC [Azospirillum sp.]HYD70224.1 copper resistance protein CopC [Azospirillum sp.]